MAGKDSEQIYVAVSRETLDVLEAAKFVRRLGAIQELVVPVVNALADRLRREPDVGAALKARTDRDSEVRPKVTELRSKRVSSRARRQRP